MNLARFAACVPVGIYQVGCLEFSHSSFGVLRRAMWPADWTVTISGSPVTFPSWFSGKWLAAYPTIDDTGRASRSITLEDVNQVVESALDGARGSSEFVQCVIRIYATDDSSLQIMEAYQVEDFSQDENGVLTVNVGTADIGNQRFPRQFHTIQNSPGLRGR